MSSSTTRVIAVIGASGQQGGGVVRALRNRGDFRVRALTRHPERHAGLADEVVAADLNRPETLDAALAGAYGVFAVTNFWEPGGADEVAQALAVIAAAKRAGVQHFVWSTLPNVEEISGGKYAVPHFTDKARVDDAVRAAGFAHHTFVVAPFFYQNLQGVVAPQPQPDGAVGWTLPVDPDAPIHMGDVAELGEIVAGAFARPDLAGNGEYLTLVGDLRSFREIVDTLAVQGHRYTFRHAPPDVFATFFPGASELSEMFGYFEAHTYMGGPVDDRVALANAVAGRRATDLATWARAHMPVTPASEAAAASS